MEQTENKGLKKTFFIWFRNLENLTKAQMETLDSLTGSRANLKVARAAEDQIGPAARIQLEQPLGQLLPGQMVLVGQPQPPRSDNEAGEDDQKAQRGHPELRQDQDTNGILEGLNSLFKAAAAKARGFRTVRNAITAYYLVAGRFELGLPRICNATHTK